MAINALAIDGGTPTRSEMLPYGHQSVDESDIQAVVDVLRGDWLTTGPMVTAFEEAVADYVGTSHAVAVNSGTAALHAAAFAAGIGAGDEVIVPPITFAASANCVLYLGGRPVFADVTPSTLNIDPDDVADKITIHTKALIAVDYAGQPCDHDALRDVAQAYGITVIEDAAHALGASYRERAVGALQDITTFSFHPVKHITTGEGGIVLTESDRYAEQMRMFRTHGIQTDFRKRAEQGSWIYEMTALGYNYRLPDLNCALGLSQLGKLPIWLARRREIAARYQEAFATLPEVEPLDILPESKPSWHLFVIKLDLGRLRVGRQQIFSALRGENIGVNVHYIPVYWHPYYQQLGYRRGLCPQAEAAYERLLTLPIFPAMTHQDVTDVIAAVHKVISHYRR